MLHATSNAFQGSFEKLTTHGDITSYFTYEFGLGFALVIPVIAIPFWKGLRRLERDQRAGAHGSQPGRAGDPKGTR